MQDTETQVEGFCFEDAETAKQAMQEYTYIGKMQDKVSKLNPEALKAFYHKLLDKHIFTTQVGYTYLYEIRSTLVEQLGFADDEIERITVAQAPRVSETEQTMSEQADSELVKLKRSRNLFVAATVVLAVVIAGIFIMLATNQNIGYVNTENKILDKYSQWAEELDAREQELDAREQALKEQGTTDTQGESIDVQE